MSALAPRYDGTVSRNHYGTTGRIELLSLATKSKLLLPDSRGYSIEKENLSIMLTNPAMPGYTKYHVSQPPQGVTIGVSGVTQCTSCIKARAARLLRLLHATRDVSVGLDVAMQ